MSDNTVVIDLYTVNIDRGRDVLTVTCPRHEIAVLRVVHGQQRVRELGKSTDTPDRECPASADAEWNRLLNTYRRVNAPDPAPIAFPLGASQLEQFGFVLGRGDNDAPAGSLVKKNPQPSKRKPADAEEKTDKAAKAK